jgi:hypothetical protein
VIQVKAKVAEIYSSIQHCSKNEVACIRTAHTITIVGLYPQRNIQIILCRLYSSPAEILASFDVDSCAVGYDGANVYASHRAFIAFVTQSNRLDRFYFSNSYKSRLYKYAARGFKIYIPSDCHYFRNNDHFVHPVQNSLTVVPKSVPCTPAFSFPNTRRCSSLPS